MIIILLRKTRKTEKNPKQKHKLCQFHHIFKTMTAGSWDTFNKLFRVIDLPQPCVLTYTEYPVFCTHPAPNSALELGWSLPGNLTKSWTMLQDEAIWTNSEASISSLTNIREILLSCIESRCFPKSGKYSYIKINILGSIDLLRSLRR